MVDVKGVKRRKQEFKHDPMVDMPTLLLDSDSAV